MGNRYGTRRPFARIAPAVFVVLASLGLSSWAGAAAELPVGYHQGSVGTTFFGDRDLSGQMLVVTQGDAARFLFEQLGKTMGIEDLGVEDRTWVARVMTSNVACFRTSGPLAAGSTLFVVTYFCQSQLRPATGEMLPEPYWRYRKLVPNGVSVGN